MKNIFALFLAIAPAFSVVAQLSFVIGGTNQSTTTTPGANFSIPPTNYAVEGTEFNLYYNNVIRTPSDAVNADGYETIVSFPFGTNAQSRYTVIPIVGQGTNGAFSISEYFSTNLLASYSGYLKIGSNSAGIGASRRVLILGDSTDANHEVITEVVRRGSTNGLQIIGVGTQGTFTNKDEARSGFTIQRFYTGDSSGSSTPFTNHSGVFDFNFYLTNNSITMSSGDWFLVSLGVNDVFSQTTDSAVATASTNFMAIFALMTANITSVVPGIRVGLCLTIPPSSSQDAFGASYSAGQTYWRYRRNRFLLTEYMIATNQTPALLVPINGCLDTVYNMSWSTNSVNARNSFQVGTLSNGVHPATSGHNQVADQIYAFLKCQE